MANNWNEFVTNVKLNTSEAENRLKNLKQKTDDLIKQRDKLINGGSSKTQVNALQKQINQLFYSSFFGLVNQIAHDLDTPFNHSGISSD